jgi:hypothetical protein
MISQLIPLVSPCKALFATFLHDNFKSKYHKHFKKLGLHMPHAKHFWKMTLYIVVSCIFL